MKLTKPSNWLATLALAMLPVLNVVADNKVSAITDHSRSVFNTPTNAKDGRDPFFPESTRVAEAAAAAAAAATTSAHPTAEVSSLKILGISGTPGHLFAIINNHTFAVGDEGDVITAAGRIHLRCVDIQHDAVTVEIAGHIHRIKLDTE